MYTVYSKLNCPHCDTIQKIFDHKNISYTKYVLEQDFTREEFISEFGEGSTFPRVLDSSGTLIGGAKETVSYLRSEGIV